MENQVLSIEQMQELIKLGIDTSKASMIWEYKGSDEDKNFYNLDILDYDNDFIAKEDIPTFTLQDILEMLPHTLEFKDVYGNTHFEYIEFWGDGWNQMAIVDPLHPSSPRITTSNISPLRAAFEMLKWCKQNNEI